MVKLLTKLLFLLLPSVTTAQSITFNVTSEGVFTTDILVHKGADVKIIATGEITLGAWAGKTGPSGILGFGLYNRFFCLGCLHGALFARIGGGEWFQVGEKDFFTAENDGKLSFAVNDKDAQNNTGHFEVTVRINEWISKLPDCPCEAPDPSRVGDGWAKDDPSAVSNYHPGASICFRSYPSVNTDSGDSGQQCCYDDRGKLITDGAGAGTPDKESSAEGENSDGSMNIWLLNATNHYLKDVNPFENMTLPAYLKVWTPNNGNGCPVNPR